MPTGESPSLAPAPGTPDPPAILVVDDNSVNRLMLSRHVERLGYVASSAADGGQALALLAGRPFALVLLDLLMPEMDGYEVLQRMKADATLRDIPVIIISGMEDQESVTRCLELGAVDYLPKPFNPVELRAKIGATLENTRP
ncbi:MAG TPA: response regulator [Chloroflexia bacterium]|nr:response regulator [Chloroflexia bacterium]